MAINHYPPQFNCSQSTGQCPGGPRVHSRFCARVFRPFSQEVGRGSLPRRRETRARLVAPRILRCASEARSAQKRECTHAPVRLQSVQRLALPAEVQAAGGNR